MQLPTILASLLTPPGQEPIGRDAAPMPGHADPFAALLVGQAAPTVSPAAQPPVQPGLASPVVIDGLLAQPPLPAVAELGGDPTLVPAASVPADGVPTPLPLPAPATFQPSVPEPTVAPSAEPAGVIEEAPRPPLPNSAPPTGEPSAEAKGPEKPGRKGSESREATRKPTAQEVVLPETPGQEPSSPGSAVKPTDGKVKRVQQEDDGAVPSEDDEADAALPACPGEQAAASDTTCNPNLMASAPMEAAAQPVVTEQPTAETSSAEAVSDAGLARSTVPVVETTLPGPDGVENDKAMPENATKEAAGSGTAVPNVSDDGGAAGAIAPDTLDAVSFAEAGTSAGERTAETRATAPAATAAPMRESAPAPARDMPGAAAMTQAAGALVSARVLAQRSHDSSRMTIELHPAELGSVEVALRVDDRGAISATFIVERADTLTMLQRDSRTLVTALADAGFSVDTGGLGFELRDQQQEPQRQPERQQPSASTERSSRNVGPFTAAAPIALSNSLYDLRV